MKKVLVALIATLIVVLVGATPAMASETTVKGSHGESISISKSVFANGNLVSVNGKHFDESVGIYVAYCVLPAKGQLPSPCGGGVNKNGIGEASYWISSNPPPYGKGLAIAFKPGGRFSQKILISRYIGKSDCKKIKCAITVRADHLAPQDRSYDIFIPVKVK